MADVEGHQDDHPESAEPTLNQSQEECLNNLREFVGSIDQDSAVKILEECDWNLELAVHKFFGLPISSSEEAVLRRRNVGTDAVPPTVNLVPPNQRIIRIADSQPHGFWWALLMLFEPIRITYHLLFGFVRYFTSFLWPDPRNQVTDPVGDVRQFIDYFKTTYVDIPLATGSSTAADDTQNASEQPSSLPAPPFFEGSYAQALQEAKRSLRFLIVYLHGDSHEDTRAFCEQTLLNEDVLRFLNNSEQLIFWGCNIKSPEGYRVSRTLRENTYPFIGVIGLTNLSASDSDRYSGSTVGMGLLGRIEGAVKPIDLIQQLNSILEDNQSATIAARFDRRERETVARIREEQDLAYQQSLEQDRAKCAAREAELRTAAVMAAQQAEAAKREETLKRARTARRARWRACLPPPPPADPSSTVRLSVKMPNGQRLSRIFSLTDSVKILYYFVLSHEESPDNFEIQANFPKRVLPCQPDDESDLEDYIKAEGDKVAPENGEPLSHRSCRTNLNDVVLDWSPKSPTSPPSFQQLGLCKPEVLFVIDKDA